MGDFNLTEEDLIKNGYESIAIINEQFFNARMIIKKKDGTEEIIDGEGKIEEFMKTHFQN